MRWRNEPKRSIQIVQLWTDIYFVVCGKHYLFINNSTQKS